MKNLFLFAGILCLLASGFTSCNKEVSDESLPLKSDKEAIDNSLKSASNKGFDSYGYNWSAHTFRGYLLNAIVGDNIDPLAEYYHWDPYMGDPDLYLEQYPDIANYFFWYFREMTVVMHWNEALISSEGVYPETWLDTDAWITFNYRMGEGESRWSQYQKMVAVNSSDHLENIITNPDGSIGYGEWYSEGDPGEFIGYYYMWPNLALIQVVNTGATPPDMWPSFNSPMGPGLGKYKLRD
ncbi:hypothetical protein EO244_11855 [Ancylomarina salipaludis]|uniref:SCP domain-containing protein n=1 Tax=Ancylomarina salipaludis TaxID=2501299 RepID=A0A4V1MZZ7_9BACT|nr:hypothetical protein [Ancylomarina salipaludis]RXQ92237.1 hypothetical protein EO244_11855 [Ancylomarina salipaludis]